MNDQDSIKNVDSQGQRHTYSQEDRANHKTYKRSPRDEGVVDEQTYTKRMRKMDIDGLKNFGYVEVKKFEHCARILQKNIRLIVNEAPDNRRIKDLLASKNLDETTMLALNSNKLVRLVAQLKTKYNRSKLKIFDDILNNNVEAKDDKEFEAEDSDDMKNPSVWPETHREMVHDQQDGKQEIKESVKEDSMDSRDFALDGMPRLPEIKDPELHGRVFVHKSIINNKSYLHKAELIASHNERLEFLGDSVLNNLVTFIIFNKFPEASEGELSKIRSLLVNNVTLAEFSIMYGFDRRLRSNINDLTLKDTTQKIYADVFEAYVGALAIERGSNNAEILEWLAKLMDSRIKKYDRQIRSIEEINKDAKSELYSLIGSASFHPQYEVIQIGDGASSPFIIHCKMGDDILGVGSAPGNKEAGLRAAMQALKNKELLEKYSQIRYNTDRSISTISHKQLRDSESIKVRPQDDNNVASETSSKLDSTIFPLAGDMSEDVDMKAKNMLYSILGKRSGIIPMYDISSISANKFDVKLIVKDMVVAKATDVSKKRAAARAAMAVMKDKDIIDYLCSL